MPVCRGGRPSPRCKIGRSAYLFASKTSQPGRERPTPYKICEGAVDNRAHPPSAAARGGGGSGGHGSRERDEIISPSPVLIVPSMNVIFDHCRSVLRRDRLIAVIRSPLMSEVRFPLSEHGVRVYGLLSASLAVDGQVGSAANSITLESVFATRRT